MRARTLGHMAQVLLHHCVLGNDEHVLLIRMYRYVGEKLKVHTNDIPSKHNSTHWGRGDQTPLQQGVTLTVGRRGATLGKRMVHWYTGFQAINNQSSGQRA